jgi:hypothetical protein
MAGVLKPLVQHARNLVPAVSPLSGWRPRAMSEARFPTWDSKIAKRGITFRTTPSKPNRRGFSYAASIHNKSAIGAIYETAGRRAAGTGKRSRPNFAQSLGRMEGSGRLQGRAMFSALNRDQGRANADVIKEFQNAAAKQYMFGDNSKKPIQQQQQVRQPFNNNTGGGMGGGGGVFGMIGNLFLILP